MMTGQHLQERDTGKDWEQLYQALAQTKPEGDGE